MLTFRVAHFSMHWSLCRMADLGREEESSPARETGSQQDKPVSPGSAKRKGWIMSQPELDEAAGSGDSSTHSETLRDKDAPAQAANGTSSRNSGIEVTNILLSLQSWDTTEPVPKKRIFFL